MSVLALILLLIVGCLTVLAVLIAAVVGVVSMLRGSSNAAAFNFIAVVVAVVVLAPLLMMGIWAARSNQEAAQRTAAITRMHEVGRQLHGHESEVLKIDVQRGAAAVKQADTAASQPASADTTAALAALASQSAPREEVPAEASATSVPIWVLAPSRKNRDGYHTRVTVGPYKTLPECEAELPEQVRAAITTYIDSYLGAGESRTFRVPPSFADEVVRETYVEKVDSSVGEMLNLHARLQFDPSAQAKIVSLWRKQRVEERMWVAGLGMVAIVGVLGTLLGYLRLDTLTKGYYSGRLKVAACAVVLAVCLVVTFVSTVVF